MKALVLSAGGLWAAWEIGAWKVLCETFQPDLIVGTSAGAWNGWAIAAGCSAEELAKLWLDPDTAHVMTFGLHPTGFLKGERCPAGPGATFPPGPGIGLVTSENSSEYATIGFCARPCASLG